VGDSASCDHRLSPAAAGGFASKVRVFPDDYDGFSVMPQRGNGLQPGGAASATLVKESNLVLNRNAVASACCIFLGENDATALRLKSLFLLVSQVSRSGNLGLEALVLWDITESSRCQITAS
jgi:hypothetical protein